MAKADYSDTVSAFSPEEIAKAEALVTDVIGRLSAGSEELRARPIDRSELVSAVVRSLTWDYKATITQIGCDQWFGIWAAADDGSFSSFIQCDRLEDGFAATWRAFADHARTVGPDSN